MAFKFIFNEHKFDIEGNIVGKEVVVIVNEGTNKK